MQKDLSEVLDLIAGIAKFIAEHSVFIAIIVGIFLTDKIKLKKAFHKIKNKPTKEDIVGLYRLFTTDDSDADEDSYEEDEDLDEEFVVDFESSTVEIEEVGTEETYETEAAEQMSPIIDDGEIFTQEDWQKLSHSTQLQNKKYRKKNLKKMMLYHEILSRPKGLK